MMKTSEILKPSCKTSNGFAVNKHGLSQSNLRHGDYVSSPNSNLLYRQAIGNQGLSRLYSSQTLDPPALKINQPNSRSEQEADHIADQVLRNSSVDGLSQKPSDKISSSPWVQFKRENSDPISSQDVNAISSPLGNVLGNGHPLPEGQRRYFETRFGQDFSHIRIHTDNRATNIAKGMGARAFTVGRDIVFRSNDYNPSSYAGRHLLAHELTHTLQQNQSHLSHTVIQKQNSPQAASQPAPQSEDDWVNVVDDAVRAAFNLRGTELTPRRARFLGHTAFDQAYISGVNRSSLEDILFGIFLDAEFDNYANNRPYQILEHNHLDYVLDTHSGIARLRRFVQQGIRQGYFVGRSREWLIQCPVRGQDCSAVRQQPYRVTPEQLVAESIGGFTTISSRRADRRVTIRAGGGSFGIATLVHETIHFYVHNRFQSMTDNRQDGSEFLFNSSISQMLTEGFTEYFSRKVIQANQPLFGGTGNSYPRELAAARHIIQTVGEREAIRAYFFGDRRQLRRVGWAIDWYKRTPQLIIPSFALDGPPPPRP